MPQVIESEVKEDFVKHIAKTLDWDALTKAASEVGTIDTQTYP